MRAKLARGGVPVRQSVFVAGVAGVLLLPAILFGAVETRTTQSATANTNIDMLKRQLESLQERVKKLEDKEEISEFDVGDDEDQKSKKAQSTVKAPFVVVDDDGDVILRVAASGGGASVKLGGAGQPSVLLSSLPSAATVVVSPAGQGPEASIAATADRMASFTVVSAQSTAVMSMSYSKGIASVSAFNSAEKMVSQMGADDNGGFATFESGSEKGAFVSMTADKDGSELILGNNTGNHVAGVLGGKDGGRVSLTGPNGGDTAARLGFDPVGGHVQVFPVGGGSMRAELNADGEVNWFTKDGDLAGQLASSTVDAGKLELYDKSGQPIVAAGSTTDGVGTVQTGPRVGGRAAAIGAGMQKASSIAGYK